MSTTTFSGPVKSLNSFDTNGEPIVTATPTTATTAANFSATRYITIKGQDGNTYYVPVAAAPW